MISGLAPTRIMLKRSVKPIIILLLVLDLIMFGWWVFERALMAYGGYDVGGIVLRFVAYALVFLLLIPLKKASTEVNTGHDRTT